jgi:hypothetical protein
MKNVQAKILISTPDFKNILLEQLYKPTCGLQTYEMSYRSVTSLLSRVRFHFLM